MKKKILTTASVCLVLILATLPLASCGEVTPTPTPEPGPGPTPGPGPVTPTPPSGEPQYGGTLKVAGEFEGYVLGYPPTLNYGVAVLYACIETLLTLDKTGTAQPWLATAWQTDVDAKTITLTLRKGVKFHDGTDFNAEAVKWNLDQFRLTGRRQFKAVESIDVIDDYTVRLNLSEVDLMIISYLTSQFGGLMISPTAFQNAGTTDEERIAWCETHPLGTGPFKFVSLERDVNMVFERFDDYWQEGKPYLDRVEFVSIDDPMVAMASFLKGEVDVLNVSTKDARDLAKRDYRLASVAGSIGVFMTDSTHPDSPFADVRVRQALEYAIDKKAICDTIGYGYWEPISQGARPGGWSWNPDVVGYPYNPGKAKELLAEAGYPNGFKTKFFTLNTPPVVMSVATATQGYLKAVGIDTTIEQYARGGWYAIAAGAGWTEGIAYFPFVGLDPNEIGGLAGFIPPGAILFKTMARPPEVQDLWLKARAATDFETMKALIQQMQKVATDKYAMVCWVAAKPTILAKQIGVHDDGFCESASDELWTPYNAWVED